MHYPFLPKHLDSSDSTDKCWGGQNLSGIVQSQEPMRGKVAETKSSPPAPSVVVSASIERGTSPVFYTSVDEEYEALTSHAGLINRSYLSKLKVVGRDALDLLQRISTNDLSDLKQGSCKHTVLTTEKGRVIDLITIYSMRDSALILICHAPGSLVRDWIQRFVIMEDVIVTDQTLDYALFSLVGPRVGDVLGRLGLSVAALNKSNKVLEADLNGLPITLGEADPIFKSGLNLLVDVRQGKEIWKKLVEVSSPYSFRPCGMGALEIQRVEKGIPMYGRELTEDVNPLEASLQTYVSFTKGCYIGQEVIARLDTYKKLQKRLMGLMLNGLRDISPSAAVIVRGQTVGAVTSSVRSKQFGSTLALAFVRTPWAAPGTQVKVSSESEQFEAEVVELPFVR